MNQSNTHLITVQIAGADPFRLPVAENEESFYRYVIQRINENLRDLKKSGSDNDGVLLAKIALYYATMLYKKTELIRSQSELLEKFEDDIDKLLAGTD